MATCVPNGTTRFERAATSLRVSAPPGGTASLVGSGGPIAQVPVLKGGITSVTTKIGLPFKGGRGGDPGDDYPWKNLVQDSRLDPWREYVRECTSFVVWALYSRNGFSMPFHDNAIGWCPMH